MRAAPSNAPASPALTTSRYRLEAQRRGKDASGLDRADTGDQRCNVLAWLPETELGFNGGGKQNHGAPMNLCVCNERRKRCGWAFA